MQSNAAEKRERPEVGRTIQEHGRPVVQLVSGAAEQATLVGKLDELYYKRPVRQHVKEFGAIFGVIFLAIGGFMFWRHGITNWSLTWLSLGFAFPLLCYFATPIMHPIWKGWMAFAMGLGVLVTGLILSIMWTAVLFPIAMLLRLIGKKVMDTSYNTGVATYWENREEKDHDFKLLERQY